MKQQFCWDLNSVGTNFSFPSQDCFCLIEHNKRTHCHAPQKFEWQGVRIMDLSQNNVSRTLIANQYNTTASHVTHHINPDDGGRAVSILKQLITWEHFTAFSHCESFKFYTAFPSYEIVLLISGKANEDSTVQKTRKLLQLTTPAVATISCTPCGMAGAEVLKEYLYQ
jgi:hypothetical protein